MSLREKIEEAKAQNKANEEHKKRFFYISTEDMILECVPNEIYEVIVDHSFKGDISALNVFKNLQKIKFDPVIHWEDLFKINIARIQSLSVKIYGNEEPRKIYSSSMKSLSIDFVGGEEATEKYSIDFTGIPFLEEVSLFNSGHLDLTSLSTLKKIKTLKLASKIPFGSDIPVLDSLETLNISGPINDFSFLEEYYELKNLMLSLTSIFDLNVLAFMDSLERIYILNDCDNMDLSPLAKLDNLKEVRVDYHPVINDEKLRENKNINLIVNDEDRDRNSILYFSPFKFNYYVSRAENDKPLSSKESFAFITESIREVQYIDYVKKMMQFDFEDDFWRINPCGKRLHEYKPEYKILYLEKYFQEYPFLTMNGKMFNQLLKENRKVASLNDPQIAQIMFICEDILKIKVNVINGTGRLIIKHGDYNYVFNEKKVISLFFEKLAPYREDYYSYDYDVDINSYYNCQSPDILRCLFSIILCIRSYFDGRKIRSDVVLTDFYSKKGNLGSFGTGHFTCYTAHFHGFKEMLYCGKNRKPTATYDDLKAICCHDEEELYTHLIMEETGAEDPELCDL